MNSVSTNNNAAGIATRAYPETTRHVAVFSLLSSKGGEEAGFIVYPSLRRSEPSIRESCSPSPRPSPLGRGRNLRQLRAISTHPAIRLVLSANQPDAVTARCASELPTRADSCSLSMRERVRVRGEGSHAYMATHFAHAPFLIRSAPRPAFAPLHRFINCLMAEASVRTE